MMSVRPQIRAYVLVWAVIGHFVQAAIELNNMNFYSVLAGQPFSVVMFFAPWCHHCHDLMPEYDKTEANLNMLGIHSIYKFNCDEAREFCRQLNIPGFPTLQIFRYGREAATYEGSRDADSLTMYFRRKYIEYGMPPIPDIKFTSPTASESHNVLDTINPFRGNSPIFKPPSLNMAQTNNFMALQQPGVYFPQASRGYDMWSPYEEPFNAARVWPSTNFRPAFNPLPLPMFELPKPITPRFRDNFFGSDQLYYRNAPKVGFGSSFLQPVTPTSPLMNFFEQPPRVQPLEMVAAPLLKYAPSPPFLGGINFFKPLLPFSVEGMKKDRMPEPEVVLWNPMVDFAHRPLVRQTIFPASHSSNRAPEYIKPSSRRLIDGTNMGLPRGFSTARTSLFNSSPRNQVQYLFNMLQRNNIPTVETN